jgi:hypothetical protein
MNDLLGRAGFAALDLERACRLGELMKDRAVHGLEPAPLHGRQSRVGDDEAAQVLERRTRSREALLEPSGERAPLAFRRTHRPEGIFEERSALLVARARAIRAHEAEGLAAREVVLLDGGRDLLLGRARDAAERERERDADRARVDAGRDGGLETSREREPTRDPLEAPAAERRDPSRPELLLDAECVDDARLVHGRDRPPGRVGSE